MTVHTLVYSTQGKPLMMMKGVLEDLNYPLEHAGSLVVDLEDNQTIDNLYVLEGGVHKKPPAPTPYHEWDWTSLCWAMPLEALDKAKTEKKAEVSKAKTAATYKPIFYQGHLFDADEVSQSKIFAWTMQINNGATIPDGFVWRDSSNVNHPADASFMLGLRTTLLLRDSYLANQSWQYKAYIDTLSSIDEVLGFVFNFEYSQ